MEIPTQIYTWLKDSGLLKSSYTASNQQIILTDLDSQKLEQGLILPLFPSFIPNLPKNSDFSQNTSKVSRLNNWNLLIRPLESLNVPLTSDTKALIVAGDRQQVLEVLQNLFKALSIISKKRVPTASYEGSLLLNNLNILAQLTETQSILEFLVLSCCQAFKVSGKIAVGLLAQNGVFLTQIIRKGVKGDFFPVIEWLESIEKNFEHLLGLIKGESASVGIILNFIKNGLDSVFEEVQDKCLKVFQSIFYVMGSVNEAVFQWFSETQIIDQVFIYLENRIDGTDGVQFIILYSNESYEIFWTNLKNYCKDNLRYLKLTQKLLPSFIKLGVITQIFNAGLISSWIDLCLNGADSDETGKGQYVMFICDIWDLFSGFFDSHEELSNNIITFMKKTIRDGSKGLRILCLGHMFEIFNSFTEKKVKYAPILYKTLIFVLVENFQNFPTREFILANFSRILTENTNVPLMLLIGPVVKQALLLEPVNFHICDLEFYVTIARHSKVSIKEAILLADLCAKILTSDTIYSFAAEIPLLMISSNFIGKSAFQDYLIKLMSLILSIKTNKSFYLEHYKGKNSRPVVFFDKIIGLGCVEFNNRLRELFNYVKTDVKNICDKNMQSFFSSLFNNDIQLSLVYPKEQKNDMTIATVSSYTPVRALYQIEKIRQKREVRENQEKLQSEQKSKKIIVEKFSLQKQIKKRRIELGVKSKLNDDEELLILNHNTVSDSQIGFMMLHDEFTETQQLLKRIFKKYSRVNRALFSKYAGLAYKQNETQALSFDRHKKKKDLLTEGDFSLLLKQFSVLNTKVTVKEIKMIFAQLCKQTTKAIRSEEFVDLLYMVASLISSKSQALSKLPEIVWLMDFYTNLEKCCEGLIPKQYFADPDPGHADPDIIQALNKKLEFDSELVLNENYKKYEEIVVEVNYKASIGRESQKIVIEILDQIFCDTFGFHFLLPIVKTGTKTRAKGVLIPEELKPAYFNKVETNPQFFKLSPHIKLHAMMMNYPEEVILECSRLVDDLIYTVEKKSGELISKLPKPAGSVSNRFLFEKRVIEMEQNNENERNEEKRKNRAKTIAKVVEKHRIEKEYHEFLEDRERERAVKQAKFQEQEKVKIMKLKKMEIDEQILQHKLKKIEERGLTQAFSPKTIVSDKSEGKKSILSQNSYLKDIKKISRTPQSIPKSSSAPKSFSNLYKRD